MFILVLVEGVLYLVYSLVDSLDLNIPGFVKIFFNFISKYSYALSSCSLKCSTPN
jgi:hypothetical protein